MGKTAADRGPVGVRGGGERDARATPRATARSSSGCAAGTAGRRPTGCPPWARRSGTSTASGPARAGLGVDARLQLGARDRASRAADAALERIALLRQRRRGASDFEDYAAFMRYAFRGSLEARYTVANLGFRGVLAAHGDGTMTRAPCRLPRGDAAWRSRSVLARACGGDRSAPRTEPAPVPGSRADAGGESIYELDLALTDDDGARARPRRSAGPHDGGGDDLHHVHVGLPARDRRHEGHRAAARPAGSRRDVAFALFSLDPGRDTPAALRRFAAEHGPRRARAGGCSRRPRTACATWPRCSA